MKKLTIEQLKELLEFYYEYNEFPDIKKYDDYWEVRQSGEKTGSRGGKTNENANLEMNDGKKNYFINAEGHIVQSAYQRIFIRHKTKS